MSRVELRHLTYESPTGSCPTRRLREGHDVQASTSTVGVAGRATASEPHTTAISVGLVMPLAVARGGCEVQLITLLSANRDGPRVAYHVCFLEDGPLVEQVRFLGYPAVVVPAGRLRQPIRFVATVLQLRDWIRQTRIQYVVSWMEKAICTPVPPPPSVACRPRGGSEASTRAATSYGSSTHCPPTTCSHVRRPPLNPFEAIAAARTSPSAIQPSTCRDLIPTPSRR